MRIRFGLPARREAVREDHCRVAYAPARRPGIPYWRWYLLVVLMALPFAWSVAFAIRNAVELKVPARLYAQGSRGEGGEVLATMELDEVHRVAPGREALVLMPGGEWRRAQVRVVSLAEAGQGGADAALLVQLRMLPLASGGEMSAGSNWPVKIKFSLLQDLWDGR